MVDFCSCGARLPEDARFCHRCGKPQFAEPPPEVESEPEIEAGDAAPVAAAAPEGPLPISFHNMHAVRSAFLTALVIFLLIGIPIFSPIGMMLKLLVVVGGGYFAVLSYTRRTGQALSVTAGARLGWITGVMLFVIWIVFFTFVLLVLQTEGGVIEAWRKELEQSNASAEAIRQFNELAQSPELWGVTLILTLALAFIAFTLLMILGGAVAAKTLDRPESGPSQ